MNRMQSRLRQVIVGLALVWVAALPISIAVAEIAMWTAAALWAVAWLHRELSAAGHDRGVPEPEAAPEGGPAGDVLTLLGTPVMVFWGISVVSAVVSRDPVESLWELREGFLFVAPLVVYAAFRRPRWRRYALYAFAAGTAVTVAWGFGETLMAVRAGSLPGPGELDIRPSGPLSHYMTYAGMLMVAVPLLLSVRGGGLSRGLAAAVAVAALVVIGLTMTRSAWIGCIVGLAVYLGCGRIPGRASPTAGRRRWAGYGVAVLVAVVVGALLLLSLVPSATLRERGASIFSLDNPTNRDRLAMAATGLDLVEAFPLLGIGPGLMPKVYPAWRVDWAVKEYNSHLHNNVLQIAAERGLLGLGAWLWMMAAFVVGPWRVLRHSGGEGEGGPEARAALAALAAFLAMGLFEYNFSDSEVLMALLFLVSLPFAASRGLVDDGASTTAAGG